MTRKLLSVSLAALLTAGGFAAAQAQQGPQGQGGPMMQQGEPIERPDQAETGAEDEQDRSMGMRGMERMHRMMEGMMQDRMGRDGGMRGMSDRHHGMRGKGYHRGMHGMRGHRMERAQMLRTMIILMDTDGDGALSLDEIQAVTERFFNAMDADDSGGLAVDEIRAFYMGGTLRGMGQDEADNGDGGDEGGIGEDNGIGEDGNGAGQAQ